MKKWRLILVMGAALAMLAASAQENALTKLNSPEALLEDLAIIRQTVEQAHPDPYRYRSKAELDQLFDGIAASFSVPVTAEDFIRATLPAFRAIGDAGTKLSPPAALQEIYDHSEPLMPITVSVIGGRLYLNEELKGFRSLPTACEITMINGRSASKVLAKLRNAQVPEGSDTTLLDRRIEQNFPEMYRRYVERAERFVINYRTADGTTDEREMFALTKEEMRQSYRAKGYDMLPWRLEEFSTTRSAWLTLGTMDPSELARQRISPERFLSNVLDALNKSKTSTLVIDLRGASGHDLGMAEQVFSIIGLEPYRVVKAVSIRSGRVPDSYRFATPTPEFFASVGGMYMPEAKGRRELKPDDPRLQPVLPLAKAFRGKVYVVSDGLTTGAAAAFVMMAKRTGRARIVGEELGSNAASFCGGKTLEISLPRSGCVLNVPLICYVPEGTPAGPTDRGEMPNYSVPQRAVDLAQGKDTVRDALLNLIAEMQ